MSETRRLITLPELSYIEDEEDIAEREAIEAENAKRDADFNSLMEAIENQEEVTDEEAERFFELADKVVDRLSKDQVIQPGKDFLEGYEPEPEETDKSEEEDGKDGEKSQTNDFVNNKKQSVMAWYTYPDSYFVENGNLWRKHEVYDRKLKENKTECIIVSRTPFLICGKTEPLGDGAVYYTIRYAANKSGTKQAEFTTTHSELLNLRLMQKVLTGHGINITDRKCYMSQMNI